VDYIHNKEGDIFKELDSDLRSNIQRIADIETLTWACKFFSIIRNPTPYVNNKANKYLAGQIGSLNTVTTSDQRLRELRDYIERDEETEKSIKVSKRMVGVLKRFHLAELIARFIEERDTWETAPKKRRKPNETRLSPLDRFVNILFPETIKYKGKNISQEEKEKRPAAKEKFEKWVRCGEPWARMVQHFSYGIILLTPDNLSNKE
jgi:hypothetical protein